MERKAWQPQLDSIRLNVTSVCSIKHFSLGLFVHLFLHYINQTQIEHILCVKQILGLGLWQETIMLLPLTKLILRGKFFQWFTPLPMFLKAYFVVLLLTFANLLIFFFTSLQGKTQCPIFLYHYQRCPSVCGSSLFRYMYTGMNSFLEAMFPVIVNLQNKRKDS